MAIETGIVMASPGNEPDRHSAAAQRELFAASETRFWTTVTAIGLTVTPLFAAAGRLCRTTG